MLFPRSRAEDIALLPSHPQWQPIFDTYGVLPRQPPSCESALEGGAVYHPILFANRVRWAQSPDYS